MQRIFALDEPQPQLAEPLAVEVGPEEEFELVVGRRQIAALAFLTVVIVALCSGGSYLAGKAMVKIDQPEPALPAPIPMIEATIVPPAAPKPAPEAPLFASPVPKAIYIQVGAVEKGIAVVLAEGLRRHALDSFVATGPGEKAFRVLIGPFPDAEAYQKARNIVDQIGLASFARRYQQE